jgi:hypothetical protein
MVTMSQKELQRVKVMENAAGGRLSRIVSMRRTSAHALTFWSLPIRPRKSLDVHVVYCAGFSSRPMILPLCAGGFLLGYQYNFNRWLAAEANYGYDRNTQFYFGGTAARVQSNIHQITGSAVVKLP